MSQIAMLMLILTGLSASGGLNAAEWKLCKSGDGIAYVRADTVCDTLEAISYTTLEVAPADSAAKAALGQAREIVMRIASVPTSAEFDELRQYLGSSAFDCIATRGMSAVESFSPDFSNTLGQDTYSLEFARSTPQKISLLIDPIAEDHEWVRYVEE